MAKALQTRVGTLGEASAARIALLAKLIDEENSYTAVKPLVMATSGRLASILFAAIEAKIVSAERVRDALTENLGVPVSLETHRPVWSRKSCGQHRLAVLQPDVDLPEIHDVAFAGTSISRFGNIGETAIANRIGLGTGEDEISIGARLAQEGGRALMFPSID